MPVGRDEGVVEVPVDLKLAVGVFVVRWYGPQPSASMAVMTSEMSQNGA